jgi:predicted N-acetyltransferase YhbS
MADPPAAAELDACLWAPDQPAVVRGDPEVAVVATVCGEDGGYIRLLCVDPAHRGRGLGHALVERAEVDLAGQPAVTVGADAPYYLWPGVETVHTSMLALFERHHYDRIDANYNIDLDLGGLPADPGGSWLATAADLDELAPFMDRNWPSWKAEVTKALRQSTLTLTRDDRGLSAVCAWDVNRAGLLGPVAVRPDLLGRGAGRPALLGALHRLRAAGRQRIEVAWVGPFVPYGRLGGTVGRIFFVYRKQLAPRPAP